MKMETLKQQILTAKGDVRAELVLKNARVINVFTNEIEQADVAIRQGVILGVGHYTGETELDLQGKYVCPGLVDGHIHIESSMLCGPAFEQAVLPHGTTAVVTDPRRSMRRISVITSDRLIESIWRRPNAGSTSSSIALEITLTVDSVRLPFLNSSHSS